MLITTDYAKIAKNAAEYKEAYEKYVSSGCKDLDAQEDFESLAPHLVCHVDYANCMTYKELYAKIVSDEKKKTTKAEKAEKKG